MSDDEHLPKSPLDFMTSDERAAAEKARLYQAHKAHGTLGIYYYLYPEDAPYQPLRGRDREDEGRER
jgi:hypothetical protein